MSRRTSWVPYLVLLAGGCGGGGPGAKPADGSAGAPDGSLPDAGPDHAGDAGPAPFDEQALIYRVYAEFGDDRLPASSPRPTDTNFDSMVLVEVARRFPSLSAGAQAILDPFLRPPSDPDSWWTTHVAAGPNPAPLAFDDTAAAPNPRCAYLANYQLRATAHTNIWYRTGDLAAEAFANVLAADVEAVYTAETSLFGRFPPTDVNVTNTCNGTDGALDIYLVPFYRESTALRAWTVPYGTGCGPGPSFIEINMLADMNATKVRALLAHEFFHTLQLGAYTFSAGCDDYDWLGEATANWAIDHVYKDNQSEVPFAAAYMAGERKVPLDQPYTFGDMDKTNGYADYVFFEYLTSKQSPSAMRTIWDATEGNDSVGATAAGMAAGGGASEVWPKFALATWNDARGNVLAELHAGDSAMPALDWGMKKIFDQRDAGGNVGDPSTPVKLEGVAGKTFKLMQTAVVSGAVALPRLSIHADYFKFTDDNVRSVLYLNVSRPTNTTNLKIQALIKKGGVWGAPDDWTKLQTKAFCRDVADERIEELALFYSNSDSKRPSEPLALDPAPMLSVSNVGCWRWQGSTSIEEQAADGTSSSRSSTTATVTFERWRPTATPNGVPGTELFQAIAGTVSGSSTTVQGCTTTGMGGGIIPMGVASGSIEVWLGLDLDMGMPLRTVIGSGGTEHPTHIVFSCPGADPIPIEGTMAWPWLELPQPDEQKVEVKTDGTIQGSYTRTFTMPLPGTRKMMWMLTPLRQ